jgi:hypothetical protein
VRRQVDQIERELEALKEFDATALQARWLELYRRPAPPFMRRDLLIRALAYRLQERAYGGLKPAIRRLLKKLQGGELDAKNLQVSVAPSLTPGVRLVREWNGEIHVVETVTDGFIWRGARYSSLSTIARAITGTNWSGPRFFGLLNKNRPPSSNTRQPRSDRRP